MRSGFTAREATQADLDRVSEIKVRNWVDTYGALLDPSVLAPFLDRDGQLVYLREKFALPGTLLLVAEDASGDVSGFALTNLDHEPDPWMESLHVLSELRGKGIGSLLMHANAAHLKGRGYNSMRLGVISGNEAAGRFYERLGGRMIGVEPVSWAPGASHQVYRWTDLTSLAGGRRHQRGDRIPGSTAESR